MKFEAIALVLFASLLNPVVSRSDDATPGDWLSKMQFAEAWKITRGSPEVKVAIIATGANYKLPALTSSILINDQEVGPYGNDGKDNDGNGYIDDIFGVNTVLRTGDPTDHHGIGTFTASLLVSPQYGLAPGVKIIPISVINQNGAGTNESVIAGIDYARQRGANLILLGVGGALNMASCDAIARTPALFVSVVGNEGRDLSDPGRGSASWIFPVDCPATNMITVAATNGGSELARFSNYGSTKVDIAAPGKNVAGMNEKGERQTYSGTSVSASIAGAVAALVMSAHPDWSVAQVKDALILGFDPSPSIEGKIRAGGTLNALKALKALTVQK